MSELLSGDFTTTNGWSDLIDELDRWKKEGRTATLWWRDDDAVLATERLNHFASIARDTPIALAVIPASANPELASWLIDSANPSMTKPIVVVQHGWSHANNAVNGKKSEFPPERSGPSVASDLAAGCARLSTLFGARALPVLAPPWNRFACRFLPLLPACGLRAISRFGPRRAARPVPGVVEVNVHVDLVAWAVNRGFVGEEAALGSIIGHLRARRWAEANVDEPTGILTHHLIQDAATERFLSRLLTITRGHSATRWLDATEVFSEALCPP